MAGFQVSIEGRDGEVTIWQSNRGVSIVKTLSRPEVNNFRRCRMRRYVTLRRAEFARP
jgi:hypothetical protein